MTRPSVPCVEAGRHVPSDDHPAWDCSQECPRCKRGERSYCTCVVRCEHPGCACARNPRCANCGEVVRFREEHVDNVGANWLCNAPEGWHPKPVENGPSSTDTDGNDPQEKQP